MSRWLIVLAPHKRPEARKKAVYPMIIIDCLYRLKMAGGGSNGTLGSGGNAKNQRNCRELEKSYKKGSSPTDQQPLIDKVS